MEPKTFRELVGQCIGEASMCWTESPKGAFKSDRAAQLVDVICEWRDGKAEIESLIKGHMEAMRPLLETWSKLK